MNRLFVSIAAALILLAAWLVVFAPGSSPQLDNRSAASSSPRHRTFHPSTPSNGLERPVTIAEKISRPPAPSLATRNTEGSPTSGGLPSPAKLRQAVEFRQALRRSGEEYNEATGNVTILQPAVWIDPADDSSLSPEHHGGLRQIAEEFNKKMEDSGLDPTSPEYRRLWNEAVRESDYKFKARYGARAWSLQHIRAHQLANSSANAENQ